MEKELKVAALRNGTVIDHIPADKLYKVVSILHLDTCEHQITIGNNLDSAKVGKKGIIKISDRAFEEDETNKIALIAPNAKINIIRDYLVVEKRPLTLPAEIKEIVQCANPNCITNNQPVTTRFHVQLHDGEIMLKCHYCEREVQRDKVKIK
ncbi:MAG: aspartate carbamoyltransferase regulatory subunit [Paludibacter sp.]|jgi:aspartate carbamoyltransferase regulatory subunit|nr:aspartate carbamoyltransferase regulatory subunit [Paludibacter sp.]